MIRKMDDEYDTYCFGTSRKSPDDKEGTETSIQNQNDLQVLVCKQKGWNLVSTEEDWDISGSDENRRGLNLQVKRAKEFKRNNPSKNVYIIAKDSKRVARNSPYLIRLLDDLSSEGIKIYSIVKGDFLDASNIGDRILSVVDEQIIYDAKIYAKLTQELKESKNLPCIPAPFGYKYDKNKNWIVVQNQAKVVRSVILDYLNKRDYKATIKDFKISKGKYYRIIKNAKLGLYSGIIAYKKGGKMFNYQGVHDPIITKELWGKVNEK